MSSSNMTISERICQILAAVVIIVVLLGSAINFLGFIGDLSEIVYHSRDLG